MQFLCFGEDKYDIWIIPQSTSYLVYFLVYYKVLGVALLEVTLQVDLYYQRRYIWQLLMQKYKLKKYLDIDTLYEFVV